LTGLLYDSLLCSAGGDISGGMFGGISFKKGVDAFFEFIIYPFISSTYGTDY
jgi:hypothetical protein